MKRTAALLAAVTAAGALSAATAAPAASAPSGPAASASAAAPYCGITWGSNPETTGDHTSSGLLTNLRSGRHACFDRLVVDLRGKIKNYDVRYGAVYEPGTGDRIPLRGTDIAIEVYAPAYDGDGNATYDPADDSEAVDVRGHRTFRQVAWGSSFEGSSTIGLGVRARLPLRAFVADGPGRGSRLVIDVAHAW